MRPHLAAKPRSAAALSLLPSPTAPPHSHFVATGCGQWRRKSDVSDLGLVPWAPEEGRVSQLFIPPHQSRLAVGQQAKEIVHCRSAERAVEEVEPDPWPRRGARRVGGGEDEASDMETTAHTVECV